MPRSIACLVVAALVAAFSWPTGVRAEPICLSIERVIEDTIERYPGSEVFMRLEGEEAWEFMDTVNAYPPPTNYPGDQIVGFYRQGESVLMLRLFVNGCRTGLILLAPSLFQRLFPNIEIPRGGLI